MTAAAPCSECGDLGLIYTSEEDKTGTPCPLCEFGRAQAAVRAVAERFVEPSPAPGKPVSA